MVKARCSPLLKNRNTNLLYDCDTQVHQIESDWSVKNAHRGSALSVTQVDKPAARELEVLLIVARDLERRPNLGARVPPMSVGEVSRRGAHLPWQALSTQRAHAVGSSRRRGVGARAIISGAHGDDESATVVREVQSASPTWVVSPCAEPPIGAACACVDTSRGPPPSSPRRRASAAHVLLAGSRSKLARQLVHTHTGARAVWKKWTTFPRWRSATPAAR